MKSHNTAVGPDEIHYEFLKQLPSCSLDFLLQAFNEVWVSGKFPTSWKQATIIPIPKPGKDNTDPSNYRPIALTSCLCKTLERMINTRLIWFLESNGLITNFQCGFRSKRSTVDHLVRLETFVREAFIKKEHKNICINVCIIKIHAPRAHEAKNQRVIAKRTSQTMKYGQDVIIQKRTDDNIQ